MSTSQPLDQIRYCERCGISFLWSAEEQRIARAPQSAHPVLQEQDQDRAEVQEQNQEQNNQQHREPAPKKQITREQITPPSLCPGCRFLLPPAGRERGLVKWYNRRKRYGFLVRRDQPEIFAHGSDIQGANSLRPGDLVEFSVEVGERGPAAKAIVILDHTDAPIED